MLFRRKRTSAEMPKGEETSVKETGMTIKTKYARGDKVDLGNYMCGYEGEIETVEQIIVDVREDRTKIVRYCFNWHCYDHIILREDEHLLKFEIIRKEHPKQEDMTKNDIVKTAGMTIKTKYAIGDKIDLGAYVLGCNGKIKTINKISVEIRKQMIVQYGFDYSNYINLLEDEHLLNYNNL